MKKINKIIFALAFSMLSMYTVDLFAQVDLLSNFSWDKFSGAKPGVESNSIDIEPTDRQIRTKTGETFFNNPPINLCGPKLKLSGDFDVSVTVDVSSNPDKYAYIDFYGSIPLVFDEWRLDGYVLRLGIKNGTLRTWVNFNEQSFTKSGLSGSVEISVARVGRQITIYADGSAVGDFDTGNYNVFAWGNMYFGAEAELDGGFTINDITASGSVSAIDNYNLYIKTYTPKTESLRNYASQLSQPFHIGATVIANALLSDPLYGKTLAEEFSVVTTEFDMKMQSIHPIEGEYAWAEVDAIVDFAEKNSMAVHGHCLVWHEAVPQWVWDIYDSGDKAHMRKVMTDHIKAVVSRYKGRINKYDLLNEIISAENQFPTGDNQYALRKDAEEDNNLSVWYWAYDDNSNSTEGRDFVIEAIRAARSVDPDVELWINEFGIHTYRSNRRVENITFLINYINSQGEKIDGVGFQSHNYSPVDDPAPASQLLANMKKLAAKGVKVRVSELDVSGIEYPSDDTHQNLFADKLGVCIDFDENPNCDGLTMWGFTERYGSMSGRDDTEQPIWDYWTWNSLIFDQSYNKRDEYDRMLALLNPINEQKPFPGPDSHTIPGVIEAEDYDYGGNGEAYYDLDSDNTGGQYRNDDVDIEVCDDGGHNVGWFGTGEWLEYTVDIEDSGEYSIYLRVATTSSSSAKLSIDGSVITANVSISSTGGWQTWETVSASGIMLTEGEQIIRLSATGDFNLDKIEFVLDKIDDTNVNEIKDEAFELGLYPNPVDDYLTIKTDAQSGQYQVMITSVDGRLLTKTTLVDAETVISVESLQTGVYIVYVTDGVKSVVKKLILN